MFQNICNQPDHKLYKLLSNLNECFYNLGNGCRFDVPVCKTKRLKNNFFYSNCIQILISFNVYEILPFILKFYSMKCLLHFQTIYLPKKTYTVKCRKYAPGLSFWSKSLFSAFYDIYTKLNVIQGIVCGIKVSCSYRL